MISLAEAPRLLSILDKEGPYGKGSTDDKPFMHRRGDLYYLSWGSYYAIGTSPYGPFRCKGALLQPEHVDPTFLNDSASHEPPGSPPRLRPKNWLNYDRHGSFFEWRGRWFFACNDQSQPGATEFFRRSVLCDVDYLADGTIAPLKLTRQGVAAPRPRRTRASEDLANAAHAAPLHPDRCGAAAQSTQVGRPPRVTPFSFTASTTKQ
jgi:hypothetical protein